MKTRLLPAALLAVVGIGGILLAASAAGARGGILAAVALTCGVALVLRSGAASADAIATDRLFDVISLAIPAALVIYFSFESGGYFPNAPATVAIFLVIVLVLRITLVEEPLAGAGAAMAIGTGALALFAIWTLASAIWSDALGRAMLDFNRTFGYLLLFALVGSVARTSRRLRLLAAFLAGAAVVVAVAALATRLAPDHFHTSIPAIGESNLAYPLTYSNALGILCVLGAILALYFATSVRLPLAARVAAAAALPLLATTIYLTLSRGPVAAAIVGLVAFVLLGRPRGLLTAAVAVIPTSVIAVASAYQHPVLTSSDPTTAAAASAGHKVAWVLVLCMAGAAGLRLALARFDSALADYRLPETSRRPVLAIAWTAGAVLLIGVALAADAPSRISDQYHRFVDSGQASPTQDVRQSLFSSANRGLVDNWSVALDAFRDRPLHGQGAGTYEVYWNQHRPAKQASYNVTDAHSLYVEVLGELGAVGFVLLAVVILAVLAALAPIRRGANRPLYAALFAAALTWTVHAGIDWDWEMPAVTTVFFALGAAGLASHVSQTRGSELTQGTRVVISLLLLAAAVTPVVVFSSQRQLNDARDALRARDCGPAISHAAKSIDTLAVRAEPYEVLALCQAQRNQVGLAIEAMRKAVQQDPNNARYHYGLAVLLGGAGQAPSKELAEAKRLNPHDPNVLSLLKRVPRGYAVDWSLELLGPEGATANR